MFKPSKSVLSYGAVAVAAGLLILGAPRAAHAIAATLVQVTNTAANPAIGQGIGQQAAQMVHLGGSPVAPGGNSFFYWISPNSPSPFSPFSVPAAQALVVTSVDVFQSCPTVQIVQLTYPLGNSGTEQKDWIIAGNNLTSHFDYPSGFVFGTGQPTMVAPAGCFAGIELYGYLTSN